MKPLTIRQLEVKKFIENFISKNGLSPTFREIARGCGCTSESNVHKHVWILEEKGHLRRGRSEGWHKARSIELITAPDSARLDYVLSQCRVFSPDGREIASRGMVDELRGGL